MWRGLLAVSCALVPLKAEASGGPIGACEDAWKQVARQHTTEGGTVDAAAAIKDWQGMASQCAGNGLYEIRLASLYAAADRPVDALKVLDSLKAFPSPYRNAARLVHLRAEVRQLAAQQNPVPMDKLRQLKPRYVAAVKETPESDIANEQIANYMIAIEDYPGAIHYASRSIELNSHQWVPNRSLAIAQAMQGEYGPAITAGRRAEEMRASLITDPEFMYAVARSYAAIGNVPVAEKTLGILAHNNPGV